MEIHKPSYIWSKNLFTSYFVGQEFSSISQKVFSSCQSFSVSINDCSFNILWFCVNFLCEFFDLVASLQELTKDLAFLLFMESYLRGRKVCLSFPLLSFWWWKSRKYWVEIGENRGKFVKKKRENGFCVSVKQNLCLY